MNDGEMSSAEEETYLEEQKELSRAKLESPNTWIERTADLAGDATIDADAIPKIVRREQAALRLRENEAPIWSETTRRPTTPDRQIGMER